MKISIKTKYIVIGTAAFLVLVSGGLFLWHHQQSQQGVLLTNQANDRAARLSGNIPATGKSASTGHISKPAENRKKEKTRTNDVVVSQNSPQESAKADAGDSNLKSSKESIDPKEESKAGEFTRADMAARMPVLAEEIRTGMARIIARGDEVMAVQQSGNLTPERVDWINEQNRELNKEWKDLFFNKINTYIAYKVNLEGRSFKYPLAEGGEFYELAQRLPPHVWPRDFDNANFIWVGGSQ